MTPDLSRRTFLSVAAGVVAGGVSACAGLPTIRPTLESDDRVSLSVDEFALNAGEKRAVYLSVPDRKYPLLLLEDEGGFTAVSTRCTHQGCGVKAAGDFLVCSCHGSTFDREGNVIRGPAPTALESFETTLEQGRIHVRMT